MKLAQKQAFAAAVTASLLFLSPMAAHAHDEVVGTTPTADASVAPGPVTVSVTFNEDIMMNPDLAGEVVNLVAPSGGQMSLESGCLTVNGATLAAKVDVQEPGQYQVNWRSVSNDGHPSDGSFNFTVEDKGQVTDGKPAFTSASDGACASTYMTLDAGPLVMGAPTKTPAPASDPFIQNLPYLGFGILLVFLGAIAGPITQRVRTKRAAVKAELKKLQDEEN